MSKKVVVLDKSVFMVGCCNRKKPGEPCLASETRVVAVLLRLPGTASVGWYPG